MNNRGHSDIETVIMLIIASVLGAAIIEGALIVMFVLSLMGYMVKLGVLWGILVAIWPAICVGGLRRLSRTMDE